MTLSTLFQDMWSFRLLGYWVTQIRYKIYKYILNWLYHCAMSQTGLIYEEKVWGARTLQDEHNNDLDTRSLGPARLSSGSSRFRNRNIVSGSFPDRRRRVFLLSHPDGSPPRKSAGKIPQCWSPLGLGPNCWKNNTYIQLTSSAHYIIIL